MFKSRLADAEEIADFIAMLSTHPIDMEFVKDYFSGFTAVLKTAPIDTLKNGDKNHNIRIKQKEKKYEMLPIETMPPLLVENGFVTDGNHRLRVLRKNKIKEALIYDVISE